MSHFTVTITGQPDTFEDQMAPFAEQEVRPEFLKFEDKEDEYRKEYDTETRREFYCSSSCSHGQVVNEEFFAKLRGLKPGAIRTISFNKNNLDLGHYFKANEHYQIGLVNPKGYPKEQVWVKVLEVEESNHPDPAIAFEGTVKLEVVNPPREIPLKETYATFEDFMTEWHGHDGPDEKTGRYGSWSNPDAKWDYWQVGGRWAGHWLIKPEFQHLYANKVPEFGWEWKEDERGRKQMQDVLKERRVDSAYKGHIDFEGMMGDQAVKAARRYDFAQQIIKDTPVNEPWSEKFWNKEGGRDEYHEQPRVKAWSEYLQKNRTACEAVGLDAWGTNVEDFNVSREKYIKICQLAAISTFAFLHEGKWAARGEMGWWACVSNEQDNWEEEFQKILDTLPDSTLLTVLDCHI